MHIGGKSSNALPIDPSQGKGALKTGDQAFNPSAKVPQLLKNPLALCHLFHGHAATFTKADVFNFADFGIKYVFYGSEAAIGSGLSWHAAVQLLLPFDKIHEKLTVSWISLRDLTIQDKSALAAGEKHLVAIFNLSFPLNNNVCVMFKYGSGKPPRYRGNSTTERSMRISRTPLFRKKIFTA